MLEIFKSSNKKRKANFIKVESQNSNKELKHKDIIVTQRKKTDKKKNKTMKGIKKLKLNNIEVKEEEKNKFSLGEIKIAKIHKEATRPLKQIKDLTKEEIKQNSCPCCGLPKKISGKLDNYKICDSPDEFTNCGEGVILYFSFFKFCIIITLIATIGISFFDCYISYYYYNKLKIFCDKLPQEDDGNTDYYYCLSDYEYAIYICEIYSKEKRLSPEPQHDDFTTFTLFDSFFFKTSLVNYNNYKYLSELMNCKFKNDKYKYTTINPNLVNFLWIVIIFIVYLIYIFFMYNKSNVANYSVYSVGDYSLILTNLEKIYKIFEENLDYIKNKENEFSNSYNKLDRSLYEEKLGFEPDKNIPKLDLFKKFLEKKLFENYDIKRIDLCYKINEIISLQNNIEELDERIERIEFDQSMIEKNEEKRIKGDNRLFYYNCCYCYAETLAQIKNKKKCQEKKLNELKESSKENISQNFCGVAFITFNTIKEQEDYLYKNKKSCCSPLIEAFITLFKIYFYILCPYCCCCFCCCCFCCCEECCITSKYKKNRNSFYFNKKLIKFERAPEPEDIIFENLEIDFKTKLKNIVFSSFISLLICSISAAIFLFLYSFQNIGEHYDQTNLAIIFQIFSFSITIITYVIDCILEIVLEKLIKCQKSYTLTNFQSTFSVNLTFFWFLNSCIVPSIYEMMFSTVNEHEIITNNLFTKFLFNSFGTPIMWTINFKFIYKNIKKCIIEKKDKIDYNQKELNELYELQSMNVAVKYSYLVKTVLMSFFFCSVFPLGFGISLIGLIFAYWLEKYNFCYMYKKPEKLDKQIAEYYITYFFIIFYAFGIGSFHFLVGVIGYFGFEFHDTWITTILIICNILLFIPFQMCLKKDFLKLKESHFHKKTYDDMYLYFVNDYERANPMTSIEGEMRYLEKLEGKNKINKKEKYKRMKQIKKQNQIKLYLRKQRLSRILNVIDLNNLLNLNDDEEQEKEPEKEKDIICDLHSKIKSGTLIENETQKRKDNKTKYKTSKKYKKNK